MKTRVALLAAGILLVLAAAGAASMQADQAATAASADHFIASLGCGANASTPVKIEGVLKAQPLSIFNTCGQCSIGAACKGATLHQACALTGGGWGNCVPPLGNNCTDGTWQCECWSGPLP